VETELSARSISLPFKDLAHKNVVAIAGGAGKVVAIRAALEGGFLKGLITDEATATALVGDEPGAGLGKKNGAKRR
jgi:DNA-binding transcriptional regulator LsrR (DeoR family)